MRSRNHKPRKGRYKAEWPKIGLTLHEKSDEAVVPMIAWTVQPCLGKGLCFNNAGVGR